MNRNCIIYGGGGFIGSHITDELLKHNYRITVFDLINSSRKNVRHVLGKIDFIEGDFTNKVDIRKSMKGQDYAIHLVSTTLPSSSNLNPNYDVETNLVTTINFLEEAVKQKIKKVIFISSGGTVYGNPLKIPIKEDHPTDPKCSYGIIKLTIEKYLYLYKELKGLKYKILRLSNPFGERQNPRLNQGLIAHLLYRIKHHKTIEIWGDGSVVRDFFYIKDGARAVYKALVDKSGVDLFNISSSKGYSIKQILEKFRKVLKLEFDVKYTSAREFDVPVNILDNRLAGKILNWKPETNFDEALKRTWRHILENE
jgi:UDP-glucose 4-epimerase